VNLLPIDVLGIKQTAGLALGTATTYLAALSTTLADVNRPANAMVAISSAAALQAAAYSQDAVSPSIVSFSLNMLSGVVTIGFSEPIDPAQIVFNQLSIQASSTGGSSVSLSSGTLSASSVTGATTITITMSSADLRALKVTVGLAKSLATSYLVCSSTFITDVAGNGVTPILSSSALAAAFYNADVVPALLSGFTFNWDASTITLTFTDVIDRSTLDASKLTIQGTMSQQPGKFFALSALSVATQAGLDYTVQIALANADSLPIKSSSSVAKGQSSTFISFSPDFLSDVYGNSVFAVSASKAAQATLFIADTHGPILNAAALDMNSGTLTLTFSEAVKFSLFDSTAVTLQNDAAAPTESQSILAQGTKSISASALVVTVVLSLNDFTALELDASIGKSSASTFVSVTSALVQDFFSNTVVPVPSTAAVNCNPVIPDTTKPSLTAFTLNMATGSLALSFSEAVQTSSLHPNAIVIQSTSSGGQSAVLTTSISAGSASGLVLAITLSTVDLNSIKSMTSLARTNANTYVSVASSLVTDIAGNAVNAVLSSSALQGTVVADNVKPSLTSFVLDMSLGQLTLTFDEIVNVATFVSGQLTLQDQQTHTSFFTLTGDVVSTVNSPSITVTMTTSDLNALKVLQTVATSRLNSYISYSGLLIADMYGNQVNSRNDASALEASAFLANTIPPSVSSFALDMNVGILTLTFSEAVKASSLSVTSITLQSSMIAGAGTSSFTLTGKTLSTATNGVVISITLLAADLNALKLGLPNLAWTTSNTYLVVSSALILDMTNLQNVAILSSAALAAAVVTKDSTAPTLNSFGLDLTAGTLSLTFSAPVLASSLSVTSLILQNAAPATSASTQYTLTASSSSASSNGLIIVISLSSTDLNFIKATTSMCTMLSNSYLSYPVGVVATSMSNVAVVSRAGASALAASAFVADSIHPTLASFDFDANSGSVYLTFSETVNSASISVTAFTFQNANNNPTVSYALMTSGSVSSLREKVTLTLANSDLNALKIIGPPLLASNKLYLSLTSSAIADYASNSIQPILTSNALLVHTFTPNAVAPTIVSYSLNMNSGILILTFSEPVQSASIVPADFGLQSSSGAGSPVFLTASSVTTVGNSLTITIALAASDINAIKAAGPLAQSASSTYLVWLINGALDTNNVALAASPTGLAINAGSYTPDSTAPALISFDLNMNDGTLHLTFSETILPAAVHATSISLQSKQNHANGGALITLSGGSAAAGADSTIIVVALVTADLNLIKLTSGLGTTTANSYLSATSSAAADVFSNALTAISSGSALAAHAIVADTTPPLLSAFALDLNAETITFSFNEPVQASSLIITQFTLQNAITATASVIFTGGSTVSVDGLTVTFSLLQVDVNSIAAQSGLAIAQSSSFVRATASFVKDEAGNFAVAINDGSAVAANSYTASTNRPTLTSYSLNRNTNIMVLTFSETVDPTTLTQASISLQSQHVLTTGQTYSLTNSIISQTRSTVVTITLSAADIRGITQLPGLTDTSMHTYLAIGSVLTDVYGNILVAIPASNALAVSTFVADTTAPTLVSFDLNMNAATLSFTFSEVVDPTTLNPSLAMIANSAGSLTYALTGGMPTSVNFNNVIVFTISQADTFALKEALGIAHAMSNTYIGLQTGFVHDASNVASASLASQQVNHFTPDTTPPVLIAFAPNLNAGTVTLQFNEPVSFASVTFPSITFVDSIGGNNIQLTTGTVSNVNSDTITLTLSTADLNSIKLNDNVAKSQGNSLISLAAGAVTDLALVANGILLQSLAATGYTADTTSPNLVSFVVNMHTSLLTLSFDEPVRVSTFTASGITLQAAATAGAISYPLATSSTSSSNGLTVAISFSASDLGTFNLGQLFTAQSDSFLRVAASTIKDMASVGNSVAPLTAVMAVQATMYTKDTHTPAISTFNVDVNAATLTLSFTKPVLPAIAFTGVTLQSAFSATAMQQFTLTSGTILSVISTPSTYGLTFALSNADFVSIRTRGILGSRASSWITISAGTVADFYSLANTATQNGVSSLQASAFTADSTAPTVSSFDFSADAGTLTLHLSRPIDFSTFQATAITLQSARIFVNGVTQVYTLTSGSTGASANAVDITVTLSAADLNAIKILTVLGKNSGSTWLVASSSLVSDFGPLALSAILSSNGLAIGTYTADVTHPVLNSFTLNMNGIPQMVLTFSEPILPTSVLVGQFTLQSASTAVMPQLYTLQSSTVSSSRSTVITITLSTTDSNSIKAIIGLARSQASSYLVLTNTAATDVVGNAIIAISNGAAQLAAAYIADTTSPQLTSFVLNLNLGRLELTFSETILAASVDPTQFTLQNAATATSHLTLTGGVVSVTNGATITIAFDVADLNSLNSMATLGKVAGNTFLTITTAAATDMTANQIVAIADGSALQAASVTSDNTTPTLSSFSINMNALTLSLTFSKVINPAATVTNLFIQDAMTSTVRYRLTGGSASGTSPTTVLVSLTMTDANAIKLAVGLATSASNSYLTLNTGFIADIFGNQIATTLTALASLHLLSPQTRQHHF